MLGLDTRLVVSQFLTPAKTEDAWLEGDFVVGKFAKDEALIIDNVVRVCEVFANCSDEPKRIVEFTKRYAPPHNRALPGGMFRFSLQEWWNWHREFREDWEDLTPDKFTPLIREATGVSSLTELQRTLPLGVDEWFQFSPKFVAFKTSYFSRLLKLCFTAIPLERLRVCAAPDCQKRYVAHHLKQTFCGSNECRNWGKRKLKLEYWKRNKERLL